MITQVHELRRLLAERFGTSHVTDDVEFSTGVALLDRAGVSRMALTEIAFSHEERRSAVAVPERGALAGVALLLHGLLHSCAQRGERIALLDGGDCFEPNALTQRDMERLLWVRCMDAGQTLQAADFIARDGNFSLMVVLLILNPARELRRIPSTAWHRLQMLLEKSGATMLVFTPYAMVGNARLRLTVEGSFPLDRLHERRSDLMTDLRVKVVRRRLGKEIL